MNKTDIFLCTFSTKNLSYDNDRLLNQALSFNIFKKIFTYDLNDLNKKTRNLIKSSSTQEPKLKGYNHGYFIWKPEIIKKTLDKIPENSFLLYVDIGCFLNLNGKSSLNKYINICDKFHVSVFNTDSLISLCLKKSIQNIKNILNITIPKWKCLNILI